MKLINKHKQKTRPKGRIANTKSNLTLSVRKDVVGETGPRFYFAIMKHNFRAAGGNRTRMTLRSRDFKSLASTNFATAA